MGIWESEKRVLRCRNKASVLHHMGIFSWVMGVWVCGIASKLCCCCCRLCLSSSVSRWIEDSSGLAIASRKVLHWMALALAITLGQFMACSFCALLFGYHRHHHHMEFLSSLAVPSPIDQEMRLSASSILHQHAVPTRKHTFLQKRCA